MQLGQARRWRSNRLRSRAGERALEVVAHQLHHLLADQVVTSSQQHHHRPLVAEFGLERGAQAAAAPVEQHPLVALGDARAPRTRPRWTVPRRRGARPRPAGGPAGRRGRRAGPGPTVAATSRSSTSASHGATGSAQAPERVEPVGARPPARWGRTVTWRCSRTPEVRARLTRMRKSQVLNDERPSKRSTPRTTPIQVSWTTSSATASLGTKVRATRSSEPLVAGDEGRRTPPRRRPGAGRAASSSDSMGCTVGRRPARRVRDAPARRGHGGGR